MPKFVGAADDPQNNIITLDTFFADKDVHCIKADIEGAEQDMLAGGVKTMHNKVKRMVICAYHKIDDEPFIKSYCTAHGFENILTSSGYLIMPQEPPYLRRGVVAAWKDDSDGSDS